MEGTPDRPIAATRTETSDSTIRLWTKNPIGGVLADTIAVTGGSLRLSDGSTMPKRSGLRDLLSAPRTFRCR
jgi:hypothetical protein